MLSLFWITVNLTAICLVMMLRPYKQSGDYDFGGILRVVWLFPISVLWATYFAIGWSMSSGVSQ